MTDTNAGSKGGGEKEHEKKLHVEVYAPRHPEPKKFTWEPSLLVRDAAAEAAKKFKYSPDGTPGLSKQGHALDNGTTLEAAGVRSGDELTLIDAGGGV